MKAAELFVRCLENEEVETIFGIPGEENIDVMDVLLDSKVRFITTRHEQGLHHHVAALPYVKAAGEVEAKTLTRFLEPGSVAEQTMLRSDKYRGLLEVPVSDYEMAALMDPFMELWGD